MSIERGGITVGWADRGEVLRTWHPHSPIGLTFGALTLEVERLLALQGTDRSLLAWLGWCAYDYSIAILSWRGCRSKHRAPTKPCGGSAREFHSKCFKNLCNLAPTPSPAEGHLAHAFRNSGSQTKWLMKAWVDLCSPFSKILTPLTHSLTSPLPLPARPCCCCSPALALS